MAGITIAKLQELQHAGVLMLHGMTSRRAIATVEAKKQALCNMLTSDNTNTI
jgi:hypothetical protein